MNEVWTAQYSGKQRAFHVDTLAESVARDRARFIDAMNNGDITNNQNDWVIIGLFDTMKEADDFCNRWKPRRDNLEAGA